MLIAIEKNNLDINFYLNKQQENLQGAGALSCFIGFVRDFNLNAQVQSLELEYFPEMTEKSLTKIAENAKLKFNLLDVIIVHRIGILKANEPIVLVATTHLHRQQAIDATAFIMDFLKTEAPFWKKENNKWLDANASDLQAKTKWL